MERRDLQHDPHTVRKRHPAHRRRHPGVHHDAGADPAHRGSEQHARRGYLDVLQVDLQNSSRCSHRDQHMEYRHGGIRRGTECGEQRIRDHRRRYIPEPYGSYRRLRGTAERDGDPAASRPLAAVVPGGDHHVGAVHLYLHHYLRTHDRDLLGHVSCPDPQWRQWSAGKAGTWDRTI